MGKKKKSFYKKQLKPFVKQNKVLLAALGGAMAGITLSNLLGSEKAQQMVHTIEESVKDFNDKVKQKYFSKRDELVTGENQRKELVTS